MSRTTSPQLSWSDDYTTELTIREPNMHHIIKLLIRNILKTTNSPKKNTWHLIRTNRVGIIKIP